MKRELARIERTFLGIEDHGIFTAFLNVNYGGAGQSIGGFNIYKVGGEYIRRTLEACGVDQWEKLVGRTIYVLFEDSSAVPVGIAPLPTEPGRQFIFDEVLR